MELITPLPTDEEQTPAESLYPRDSIPPLTFGDPASTPKPDGTGSFCRACHKLIYEKALPAHRTRTLVLEEPFKSYAQLQESARARCPLCLRLDYRIRSDRNYQCPDPSDVTIHTAVTAYESGPSSRVSFMVYERHESPTSGDSVCMAFHDLYYLVDPHDQARSLPSLPESSLNWKRRHDQRITSLRASSGPSTSSPSTFTRIREWHSICTSKHQKCTSWRSRARLPQGLPTRLLSVGADDGHAPPPSIRLVTSTSSLPRHTPYATLSHCWGGRASLQLLRGNVKELENGIEDAALPRTFREAVDATRALGWGYLWIDALCIVQDDEVDWEREAVRMGAVYAGSALNLSADVAEDGEGGLFREREAGLLTGFRVTDGVGDYVFGFETVREEVGGAVVNQRAWVVQERFLAPRVVHFGERQVFWECGEMSGVELAEVWDLDRGEGGLKSMVNWYLGDDAEVKRLWLQMIWDSVMTSYSRGRMTFSKDRPIALAGIARAVAGILGMEAESYANGSWKSMFPDCLLWYTLNGYRPTEQNSSCTWSWLSVEGDVIPRVRRPGLGTRSYRWFTEMIEVSTVATNDPYSSIQKGHVRIRGPLCRFAVEYSPIHQSDVLIFGDAKHTFTDDLFETHSDDGYPFTQVAPEQLVFLLCRVGEPEEGVSDDDGRCARPEDCSTYEGLLLAPIDGQDGCHRRVGQLYFTHRRSGVEGARQHLASAIESCFKMDVIPAKFYHAVDVRRMYEITIL